jgi:D-xylose transport system permease protein
VSAQTSNDQGTSGQPGLQQRSLRSKASEAVGGRFRSVPVIAALVVIWLIFYSQNSAFLSVGNLTNLSLQIVTTAILALGVTFVLLVGEIDLSGAALGAVAATIAARLAVGAGWPIWLALGVGMAIGIVIALIEGLIIVFGVPSLITTLGFMVILQGFLLIVLPPEFSVSVGGSAYADIAGTSLPPKVSLPIAILGCLIYAVARWRGLRDTDRQHLVRTFIIPVAAVTVVVVLIIGVLSAGNGLPLPVALLFGMLLLGSYFTTQTRYGSHLHAVGGNRDAAARAGIPVARMVIYSFMILGACASVAGIVDASRLMAVSASSGTGSLMLDAIAAAVVGGVSLFGGRGTVWAALIGALIIGSINNGVQLLGFSTQVQELATGAVLIASVAIDVVITRGTLLPRRP